MRLLKYITDLPEGRKQAVTFLLFVLFSAGIWTVNALNQSHTVKTKIAVRSDRQLAGARQLPREIEIEMTGRGFDLIPVLSAASSCTLIDPGNDSVWNLRQSVNSRLIPQGKNIQLISVQPGTIHLDLAKRYTKRLPIVPMVNIRSGSGWIQSGPVGIWPDSITLISDQRFPDDIKQITTKPADLSIASGPHFGGLALSIPPGMTTLDQSRAWIYVPAERATEARIKVEIRSCSPGLLSVPGTAEVRCRVPLSRYAETTSDRFIVIAEPNPSDPELGLLKILHAPFWCSNIITQPLSVRMFRTNSPAS